MTETTSTTAAIVVREPRQIEAHLVEREAELAALLRGSDVSPDRFIKATVHALVRYPDVMKAPVASVLLAVLEAAEMGLEPTGSYGGAHLIRYADRVNVLVDYRGFVKMALRSGQVRSVSADVVYAGDDFSYSRGTKPRIDHTPTLSDAKRGNVTHVYAIAVLNAGGADFVVMTQAEVEAIRRRARSSTTGPWTSDWGEMAKKTAVRRLFKLIPVAITPQLAVALEREDRDEGAEGAFAPAPVDPGRRSLLARLGVATPEGIATPVPPVDDGTQAAILPEQALDEDSGLPAIPVR